MQAGVHSFRLEDGVGEAVRVGRWRFLQALLFLWREAEAEVDAECVEELPHLRFLIVWGHDTSMAARAVVPSPDWRSAYPSPSSSRAQCREHGLT